MLDSAMKLPVPVNLSSWWNFGSLLMFCLFTQILTGVFLALYYIPHADMAFSSVDHIMRNVNWGWLVRLIHANGASFFFLCLYCHMGRGIYYGSYLFFEVWNVGVVLFLLSMATAFLGYVLPWGQMSLWGATVITNIFSAIPYLGSSLVLWIWGGFSVDSPTLTRFYAFHFLLPMALSGLTLVHFLLLHRTCSSNPLGLNSDSNMVAFHPYYTVKDFLGAVVLYGCLIMIVLLSPYALGDPENFLMANPLATPVHIMPEWYFLWVYAILRSIPNKLGGVVSMAAALLILFLFPILHSGIFRSGSMYPISRGMFWVMSSSLVLLTWIGSRPVEYPYITLGLMFTLIYFFSILVGLLSQGWWDSLMES